MLDHMISLTMDRPGVYVCFMTLLSLGLLELIASLTQQKGTRTDFLATLR